MNWGKQKLRKEDIRMNWKIYDPPSPRRTTTTSQRFFLGRGGKQLQLHFFFGGGGGRETTATAGQGPVDSFSGPKASSRFI